MSATRETLTASSFGEVTEGRGRHPEKREGQSPGPGQVDADVRGRIAADGRNVDERLGTLGGEGSLQRSVQAPSASGFPIPRLDSTAVGGSYYGLPMLQANPWRWAIPAYLWVGGASGASAALAAAAQLRPGLRGVVRAGHWIAAGGAAVSAGLLIEDLGRPERFLNMFRVFRPTSPMSVGSWVLGAFGGVATVAAGLPLLSRRFPRRAGALEQLSQVSGVAAGALGLAVSTYTAVLLSGTAVPVWQGAKHTLPWLFGASAGATAASLLELAPLGHREHAAVRRFALVCKAAELGALGAVQAEVSVVPQAGRHLREGLAGTLLRAGWALGAASFLLSLRRRPTSRRRIAAGVLGALGTLAVRAGIYRAGNASALDAKAAFAQQRARLRARGEAIAAH